MSQSPIPYGTRNTEVCSVGITASGPVCCGIAYPDIHSLFYAKQLQYLFQQGEQSPQYTDAQ